MNLTLLDGLLLGDGNLCKPSRGNAYFTYNTSSEQHAKFVHSILEDHLAPAYIKEPKLYYRVDNRSGKRFPQYSLRTSSKEEYTELYVRWYKEGVKTIPRNIIVTSEILLHWYIGDGQLESKAQYIYLHTNSFSKQDIENILIPQLSQFAAYIVCKEKKYWLIRIPRKCVEVFLRYIGPSPFLDYAHKWDYTDYKNQNIKEHGFTFYEFDEAIRLFSEGHTIYKISKQLGIPIKCIKNYFEKNKISYTSIVNKKVVQQFTMDGEFVDQFESVSHAAHKYGYTVSAISECCRGIRKQYKKSTWKFKID